MDSLRWKAARHPEAHPLTRVSGAENETPWWVNAQFPQVGSNFFTNPDRIIGHGLLRRACEGGPPVRSAFYNGNLVVPAKQLLRTCASVLKLRPVWVEGDTRHGTHLFAADDTMVRLHFHTQGRRASVQAVTTNPEVYDRSDQLFQTVLSPDDPKKGMVFTLAKTMSGYTLTHLGLAGSPIERGNYSKEVLASYDHVVEDLNSEDPCGRLIVMAGEPGTGKTYLIRGLLGAVPKAAFVLVPPHLVEDLSSPEILPSLTAAKGEMSGPLVLILEDADRVLVPRHDKMGSMNAISQVLNLGDGILGSVLDIRIVASTNAAKVEMDPATRRPGRLCRYSSVEALSAKEASDALSRLTGKPFRVNKPATLAQVYRWARENGWKPPSKTASAVPTEPLRTEILYDDASEPNAGY